MLLNHRQVLLRKYLHVRVPSVVDLVVEGRNRSGVASDLTVQLDAVEAAGTSGMHCRQQAVLGRVQTLAQRGAFRSGQLRQLLRCLGVVVNHLLRKGAYSRTAGFLSAIWAV